jgi:SAM-dependent methyltransferase
VTTFWGEVAFKKFEAALPRNARVLDIGSFEGTATRALIEHGHTVTAFDWTIDKRMWPEDYELEADYFDGVWASHVLEHQRNVGSFLDAIYTVLKPDGLLGVVVPPLKHEIVGGHLTLWNAGLLLYNLIRARFDCRSAMVKTAGYNVAVLVRKSPALFNRAALVECKGDIEVLAPWFPMPVMQGFDGRIDSLNWE